MLMEIHKLYDELEKYLKDNENTAELILRNLEKEIIFGRDKLKIPIYLTKWRLKSTESSYIKIKRKKYNCKEQIKDLLGLRVLCLFEQDIIPTNKFILDVLKGKLKDSEESEYELEEFTLYNWESNLDDLCFGKKLKEDLKINYKIEPFEETKISGYKSIHYLVKIKYGPKYYWIEIQLRTIFQDTWAVFYNRKLYQISLENCTT